MLPVLWRIVASGLGEIHFQQHQRDPGIHLLISKQFFA
jgi:hypothetical protein